ncbi:MAG: serine hydroxymethyltransferase [Candidatus Vogelbacteria bacterium]|nr:serine hydroxymethyltransferase [Candidatus Vogelbacteria bacterium]
MKDKQIEKLIKAEEKRQKSVVNLIASENYVSKDVLEALGSVLTNKYAEGYAGARYYGGNQVIDQVENLCKERALKLFKLSSTKWAVNVQPLSGSPANVAVYLALVPPGDLNGKAVGQGKIMGMSLDQGGHLTHGHKVSITGKFWQQIPYGVNKETEQLDYSEIKKIAMKEKPNIIVAGFTAYPRKIDWQKFREIANAVVHPEHGRMGYPDGRKGAYLMVDMSHIAGLVAGGVHPSPFPYADIVTTTTHKTLRGPRAGLIFSRIDNRELNKKIDKAVFPGMQGGPHANQIAATAVALDEALKPEFKKYAKLMDVAGSTDGKIAGKEASARLEKEGIIVNKNTIPFDTRSPVDPSGLRLGTAAETTRGKKEKDMIKIAERIDKILRK